MKNWLTAIVAIILITLFFWLGFKAHERFRPCPVVKSDTVYVYDTVTHYIRDTVPYYVERLDSIIVRDTVPRIVDTALILLDYYFLHYYTGEWKDTLIDVTIQDAVTENKIIDRTLTYRLLKPVTVINNSVTNINYSSYFYTGLSIPVNDYKFTAGNVYFANKALLIGVGYIPYYKAVNVTAGFKLFKFNK